MIYEIKSFTGLSDYEDKGIAGSFKFGANLDVRKRIDSLSAGQALTEEGLSGSPSASQSPSASTSPSSSPSTTPSPSASQSPSASPSSSASPSTGISPSPSRSPSASQSPSASVSPSHSNSPSPSPSAGLSTVFDDLIHWFVESSDGYVYGFGNTGSIYRRDSDGITIRVYKDPNGAIKGASEWFTSDNKVWLYWATNNELVRKELPGRDDWNDVESVGSLSTADYHMIKQAGGALMIGNGSNVAFVGYDGSFTPEATDLIPGNLIKTVVERDGRGIFGTVNASNTAKGVNGAIDTEYPLAQIGDNGEIFYANMTDSIPITRFPGGGKVNPGGVANELTPINFFEYEEGASSWIDKNAVGNMAMFGVFNADSGKNGIYTYGRRRKNNPFVLNLEYEMDVDEIGAVISTNDIVLASYKDGTDFGVRAEDPNNKATGTYEGLDFKAPVKRPQNIVNWKMAELFFDPLPNGSSIEFWYKLDKTGSFVQAKVDDGSTSFSTANKKKAVFLIGANAQIFEPRVVLNPFGNYTPEVHRLRIYFQ